MTTRVPPAPARDRRHRRHSVKTMQMVRGMSDGGWTPTQIRRYLRERGIDPPSANTISRWASDQRHELANQRRVEQRRVRARKRDWANLRARWTTGDWQARMIELRCEVGLTSSAIARLLRHDLGVEITEQQVRETVGHMERAA